jgi:hypothetical protein
MNGTGGITGMGYTGIGVTGQDVLIYGNLLVTGGIDPTYLALTPISSGPSGLINPLWVDSVNGNALRSQKIYIDQSTIGGVTDPILKMENTNAGITGTQVELYKNSASPAVSDIISTLSFNANNNATTKVEYARIQADQRDITAGSENGSISVLVCENSATPVEYLRVNGSAGTTDLYKGLNLQTQSITGTTGAITLTNGGSQANVQANLGFTSVVQATPTTKATLFNTGISVETNINKVIIAPTSIVKSVGSASLTVGTVGSAPLVLIGSGGNADGVQITQVPNVPTTLTTTIANTKYYPDTLINNNNLNTIGVPAPQTTYQRLTLTNLGLTNTNQWNDYGNNVYTGYSAFTSDVNGNIWLAQQGSGEIQVWDSTITTQLYTILLENGGNPKSIDVFKQVGSFMYIGGSFNSINGNATPQYNITRVSTVSYTEDPIFDGTSFIYGTEQNSFVYAIEYDASNDRIFFGGNFTQLSNGAPCLRIGQIDFATNIGGSQIYSVIDGGVDNTVYAIHYDTTSTNYLYVGGSFTTVGVNSFSQNMNYGAVYYPLGGTWQAPFCQNQFNGTVSVIIPSASTAYLFVAGAFANPSPLTGSPYSVYVEVIDAQNLYSDTGLSLGTPPTQKQAYGTGGVPAVAGANIFYIESGFAVWTSLGTPTGAGSITGINNFAGNWKVIYDSYGFVRSHLSLPHSCIFTGSFVYDAVAYGNYTITTRNVSQQFIGDDNNSYWSIIGAGVGTFS